MFIRVRPPWWFFLFRKARPDPDDRAWRKLRAFVLRRDRRQCQIRRWGGWGPRCGKYATVVDHEWPLAWGGHNGPENLVAACWTCNERKGAALPIWAVPRVAALVAMPLSWVVVTGLALGFASAAHVHGLATVTTALVRAWVK